MAARRNPSSPKTVRRTTACLLIVLSFAAGLMLGTFLPGVRAPSSPDADGPSGAAQAHIQELEAFTAQHPDNAPAWTHLGDAYYDAGRPEQAVRAYERALALDPDNPDVLTDLGTAYRLTGNYDQAIARYNAALARQPRHEHARLNKGIVLYYDLGRKQEALETWNRLLQLVPEAKGPDNTPLKDFIARHSAQ